MKKADYLENYIKELLLPSVQNDGFVLLKSKTLVRVQGPFIDCISFQLSQYGSKEFYVHYYKNLISDPLLNIDTYKVGSRISNNNQNGDSSDWCGADERQAESAMRSVVDVYAKEIKPWFESITSIPEYILEIAVKHDNKGFHCLQDAVAFAEVGKRDRAWWICNDILNEMTPVDTDEDNRAALLKVHDACQQYSNAHDVESILKLNTSNTDSKVLEALSMVQLPDTEVNSIEELLTLWKKENIDKYKLAECIA